MLKGGVLERASVLGGRDAGRGGCRGGAGGAGGAGGHLDAPCGHLCPACDKYFTKLEAMRSHLLAKGGAVHINYRAHTTIEGGGTVDDSSGPSKSARRKARKARLEADGVEADGVEKKLKLAGQ